MRPQLRGKEKMTVQNTIAFAADHAGVELKDHLRAMAEQHGFSVLDFGAHRRDSVDYPDYAQAAGQAVVDGHAGLGVLVCGSGTGRPVCVGVRTDRGCQREGCRPFSEAKG